MIRVGVFLMAWNLTGWAWADCTGVVSDLKLPVVLKTRGQPKTIRWEQVEKTLTRVRKGLQGHACQLSFWQIFVLKSNQQAFFPVIGNLLRTAPEESLVGLPLFDVDGAQIGHFENRVTYEKKGEYSYTHYYFQFRDHSGELQSSGNRLLIDIPTGKPFFLVKWEDLKSRTAISSRPYLGREGAIR